MMSPFAIVPVEACQDPRLTKMQLRMLICLLSFRAKNTDTVWPSRDELSLRSGYSPSVCSRVTSQLVGLGWLEKSQRGRKRSAVYKITVPDLVTVSEPNNEAKTVTDSVTVSNDKSVTSPVTDSESENSDQFGNSIESPNSDHSGNGYQTGNSDQFEHKTVTTPDTKQLPNWSQAYEHTKNIPGTNHISRPGKIPDSHPEDLRLAEFILSGVVDAVPKTKHPDLTKWANTIRLMRERDSLTRREIAEVFAWANKHKFWRLNILSPESLREKFARLSAEKETDHAGSNSHTERPGASVTEQSTVGRASAAAERKRQEVLARYGHGTGSGHDRPVESNGGAVRGEVVEAVRGHG